MTTTENDIEITVPADNVLWDWFYARYRDINFAGSGYMRDFGSAENTSTALWAMREGFRLLIEAWKGGWRPSSHEDAAQHLESLIPYGYARTRERFITAMTDVFSAHQDNIQALIEGIPVVEAGTGTSDPVHPARDWSDTRSESRGYAVNLSSGTVLGYNSRNVEAHTIRTRNGDEPESDFMPVWTDDRIQLIGDCGEGSGFHAGDVIRYLRWGDINLMYVEALTDDGRDANRYVRTSNVVWVGASLAVEQAEGAVITVGGVEYVRKDVVDSDVETLSSTLIRASRRENLCGVYDATVSLANRRTAYVKIGERRKDRLVTVRETYSVTRIVRVDGMETDEQARDEALRNLTRVVLGTETNQRVTATTSLTRDAQEVIAVENA